MPLVEVGTTNRTRRADYERAITPATALLLKVHASNYRMVGFTEAAPIDELATLGLPIMVDAGSGLLDETTPWLPSRPPWLRDEPGVTQAIAAGATVVTFSGDKLLGGPQAGVIVGDATSIATDRQAPARPRDASRQDDARRAAAGRADLPERRRHLHSVVANGHHIDRRAARPSPGHGRRESGPPRWSTPRPSRAVDRCRG